MWLKTGDMSTSEAKTLPITLSSILRNSAAGSQTSQVNDLALYLPFLQSWVSRSYYWPPGVLLLISALVQAVMKMLK